MVVNVETTSISQQNSIDDLEATGDSNFSKKFLNWRKEAPKASLAFDLWPPFCKIYELSYIVVQDQNFLWKDQLPEFMKIGLPSIEEVILDR